MMSNIIKMEQQEAIAGLKAQGWSNRKIAKVGCPLKTEPLEMLVWSLYKGPR